jgi:hypothetical protein
VETEESAVAREQLINMSPRQRTCDATTEELLETVFSIGSVRGQRLLNMEAEESALLRATAVSSH